MGSQWKVFRQLPRCRKIFSTSFDSKGLTHRFLCCCCRVSPTWSNQQPLTFLSPKCYNAKLSVGAPCTGYQSQQRTLSTSAHHILVSQSPRKIQHSQALEWTELDLHKEDRVRSALIVHNGSPWPAGLSQQLMRGNLPIRMPFVPR